MKTAAAALLLLTHRAILAAAYRAREYQAETEGKACPPVGILHLAFFALRASIILRFLISSLIDNNICYLWSWW